MQKPEPEHAAPIVGQAIKNLRAEAGLTISDLATQSGMSEATLSRVENGRTEISAHNLYKVATVLDVDISLFFGSIGQQLAQGARCITRKGEAPLFPTPHFTSEILGVDLLAKKMHPFINTVTAQTLQEAGGCTAHEGEEFLYVLSGELILHSSTYSPVLLREGDNIYFDGRMPHAYVSGRETPASILVINTAVSDRKNL